MSQITSLRITAFDRHGNLLQESESVCFQTARDSILEDLEYSHDKRQPSYFQIKLLYHNPRNIYNSKTKTYIEPKILAKWIRDYNRIAKKRYRLPPLRPGMSTKRYYQKTSFDISPTMAMPGITAALIWYRFPTEEPDVVRRYYQLRQKRYGFVESYILAWCEAEQPRYCDRILNGGSLLSETVEFVRKACIENVYYACLNRLENEYCEILAPFLFWHGVSCNFKQNRYSSEYKKPFKDSSFCCYNVEKTDCFLWDAYYAMLSRRQLSLFGKSNKWFWSDYPVLFVRKEDLIKRKYRKLLTGSITGLEKAVREYQKTANKKADVPPVFVPAKGELSYAKILHEASGSS